MGKRNVGATGRILALSLLSVGVSGRPARGQHKVVAPGTTQGGFQEADSHMMEGAEALRRGDAAEAAEHFRAVTRLSPTFAEGYLDLGLALEQQLNYPGAAEALQKARRLKPTLKGANLFLGIAEYQVGALPQATEALEREVKLNPTDAKARMWLGICQTDTGHAAEGAATLDVAAVLAPKDVDILYHRGRAHTLVSKQSYEQMYAVAPDSFRVHEVMAQADAEAERNDDAIAQYKQAIERAPHYAGLHEELGDLYWTTGKTDAAEEAYGQELANDPFSVTTCYKLGSLRVIRGRPQEAVTLLEKAIGLEPQFEQARYYLGRAQIDLGQDAAGIATLHQVTEAQGDVTLKTLAYYQLARALRRLHRTDEANAALAQFRTLREQKQAADQSKVETHAREIDKRRQLPVQDPIPADTGGTAP